MSGGDVALGIPVASYLAKKPERTTIEGRCAKLIPLDESHIPSLYRHLCDAASASVWAYMWVGPFDSEDEFGAYIRSIIRSENPIYYTVVTTQALPGKAVEAGTPVGYLSLGRIDLANRSVEVGDVTFSACLQRTTAATEALYLAMRYAVDDLGNRRVEWRCDSLHVKSRRAAERLGFTYEGLFRKFKIFRGRNRDTVWYSVTDDDWAGTTTSSDGASGDQGVAGAGLRSMFDAWLDPSNFAEGRQIRSLEKIREDLKIGAGQ